MDIGPGKPSKPNLGLTRRLMARCYHCAREKRRIVPGSASFESPKMDPIRVQTGDTKCLVSVRCKISLEGEIGFVLSEKRMLSKGRVRSWAGLRRVL